MVGEQQGLSYHVKRLSQDLYKPMAQKLDEARVKQGLKKMYFTMMLCTKRRIVERYFTGERTPNYVVLYLLSRRLGISLDDLFDTPEMRQLYDEFIHNEELLDEWGLR